MGDQEAWLELCDLYVNEGEYGRAAFCLEEVILLNPHCHFYHQKYAEIRYTMGGLDNLDLARSYFSQAVKLKGDNVRALYGLVLTCGHLAASPKSINPNKKKECVRLAKVNTVFPNFFFLAILSIFDIFANIQVFSNFLKYSEI
jgi:tetratricopeptide (TPR) repeat protein